MRVVVGRINAPVVASMRMRNVLNAVSDLRHANISNDTCKSRLAGTGTWSHMFGLTEYISIFKRSVASEELYLPRRMSSNFLRFSSTDLQDMQVSFVVRVPDDMLLCTHVFLHGLSGSPGALRSKHLTRAISRHASISALV